MNSPIKFFHGIGPYTNTTTESTEIAVLKNKATQNFIFMLKTQEYGPIIVDKDFERGKGKFKKAFEKMLIYRSLLSIPEAKEDVSDYINETHPEFQSEILNDKTEFSDARILDIAEKAKKKLVEVFTDVDNLVLHED
jgi:hypothetical protein